MKSNTLKRVVGSAGGVPVGIGRGVLVPDGVAAAAASGVGVAAEAAAVAVAC
jgi:hypothetical protein